MVQLFMRNDEFEWIWLIQELHDVGFWPLSFWLRLRRRGDLNRPLINHRQELLDIWIFLRHWYWAEIMENSQLHCWGLLENKYNSTTDIDMLSLSLSTCHRLSQVWIEVILLVSLQKISKACLRCLWWMCGMSQKQTAKSASLPVSAVGTVSVVSIIPPLDYTSRQIVQLYEKTCHTQWHCFQAQLDTNWLLPRTP